MTQTFFKAEFAELEAKIEYLIQRNSVINANSKQLQAQLYNATFEADQKILELEEENKRLITKNADLNHRLSLVLKRVESLS
ncbi:hypothetical protein AwWohl_12390 [Gammaproteobacteria bacterium]|nr:hypothetical protein AwWohl_12390 [Gammaproteobacteria bacterium]